MYLKPRLNETRHLLEITSVLYEKILHDNNIFFNALTLRKDIHVPYCVIAIDIG